MKILEKLGVFDTIDAVLIILVFAAFIGGIITFIYVSYQLVANLINWF